MAINKNINAILAVGVFAVSAIVYSLTAGPTVALWDCGEYLASAGCLGIPHPPGTPLLIPIFRIFYLLFSFIGDPGFRLNLLSGFGSAAVVMFIYLIIVRTMRYIVGEAQTLTQQLIVYCAGVSGALLCAFGNTFWFCSLEASEQNNFSLLPVVITIWLALVWAQSKDPRRDRLLILLAYVGFLGIGIHMISGITLPAVFLFVMLVDESKRRDWRLWLVGVCMATFMYNLSYFIAVSITSTLVTFVMTLFKGKNQAKWQFCFWFSLFAVIGFSNHIYLPVRASLNPIIDEDHPVTWKAFSETLDRKQYGSESMVSRSFWRRGALSRQFGIEGHMGYGGFHITQFFHFSPKDTQKNFMEGHPVSGTVKLLIYLIPTLLMLYGWWYLYRRNRSAAVLLVLVTLMTTVVLTWYMNFSDGTRAEHRDYLSWIHANKPGPMPTVYREVRVRDYFWNAGFMFFGMWLGIAGGCLLTALFASRNTMLRLTAAPMVMVLFFVSPALPLTQNYKARDRHMNWIPYDAAYNLLMSCDRDGILVTNGDNDTFPLWALQEAYGIRKDVRIINLSLLNTDWYIRQLKKLEPRVPISFTDGQIGKLGASVNPFPEPTPYMLPEAGIQIVIPGRRQQNVMRVQDLMILNIVDSNRWRKPLYFAITVSDDNFMGLGPYLRMEGMVYRICPKAVAENDRVDIEKTVSLLDSTFRFGTAKITDDPADEAARGLMANYTACYIELGLAMRKPLENARIELDSLGRQIAADSAQTQTERDSLKNELAVKRGVYEGRLDMITRELRTCITHVPGDWRPRALLTEFLLNHGRFADAESAARDAVAMEPANTDFLRILAQALEAQNKKGDAIPVYRRIIGLAPDSYEGFERLARLYAASGSTDSALDIISEFENRHTGDVRAKRFRQLLAANVTEAAQPAH